MQRTAELLRLWGAEEEVRRRGVPREFCDRMVWTTTLSGEELGRTDSVEPDDKAPEPQSPTTGLRCPQNITESVLPDRAQTHGIADLHYGFEMTGFEQDDDGVTATGGGFVLFTGSDGAAWRAAAEEAAAPIAAP